MEIPRCYIHWPAQHKVMTTSMTRWAIVGNHCFRFQFSANTNSLCHASYPQDSSTNCRKLLTWWCHSGCTCSVWVMQEICAKNMSLKWKMLNILCYLNQLGHIRIYTEAILQYYTQISLNHQDLARTISPLSSAASFD